MGGHKIQHETNQPMSQRNIPHILSSFSSLDCVGIDVDIREVVVEYGSRRVHHSVSHGRTHTYTVPVSQLKIILT